MVTVGEGVREVKDSGSKMLQRVEMGALAVYDWLSGPPMTDQQRIQHRLAELETARRYTRGVL